jgi:mannosyltransferase
MTPLQTVAARSWVHQHLALALIVLLAFTVRLYDLAGESIWADEAYSIAMAQRPAAEIVARTAAEDTSPPLYYLVLHAWLSLFGDSPAAARMPSVVAGTLAVPFAYLVAAPLTGPLGALIASLIHALSPFLVAYSQEARQYAFLSCASLASFAFLIRLLDGRRSAMPAYIATTVLMCYSHSVGSFVLLAQMAFTVTVAFFMNGLPWRQGLTAQAVSVATFLPWSIYSLRQYTTLGGVFWVPIPTLYTIEETFFEYVQSSLVLHLFVVLAALGFVQLSPAAGDVSRRNIVRSLGGLSWTVRLADLKSSWLLVCWMAVPIGILFVISRAGTPLYLTRATIAAASAFYLLAARGLAQLRRLAVPGTVVVAALLSAELVAYYQRITKEQWQMVSRDVAALAQPGDVFVFHEESRRAAFDYYVTRQDLHRVGFPHRQFADEDAVNEEDMRAFPQLLDSSPRVWLVLAHSKDRRNLIRDHLLQSRAVVFQRQYAGVELWMLERSRR